jgi:hypothetical protein
MCAHVSVYDDATMERMAWTDDRLQERFDSIDRRFDEVDRRFDKVDAELQAINVRFDSLQRTMIQTGGGMIIALIGLIATQL